MTSKEFLAQEINDIEDEIVQFLSTSPIFIGQNPLLKKIKAYFATRRDLTQSQLQELTGYSSGAISQALKELVKTRYIQKSRTSSTGEITYSMRSIILAYLTAHLDAIKISMKMGEELEMIKADLEKNKRELEVLNGYDVLCKWVDNFLEIIADPTQKELVSRLENQKTALENNFSKKIY